MTPRYITVDDAGQIYEVHDLLDEHARPTTDPVLANWVMVKVSENHSVEQFAANVPIYTVH